MLPHMAHTGDAALTMRDCMRHALLLCVRLPSTLAHTRQRDAPLVSVAQSRQGLRTGMCYCLSIATLVGLYEPLTLAISAWISDASTAAVNAT